MSLACAPARPDPPGRRRALLADADGPTLAVVRHRLERAGLDVETSSDGPGALASIRRSKPDVVAAADALPGLGGVSFLETLRAEGPDVPVVVVAWPDDEAVARAFAAGAADVVVPPLSIVEVSARVLRLAASRAVGT